MGSTDSAKNSVKVRPPSWRVDLSQSRDVVEEIARIIGFDAVPMEQLFAPKALSSRAPLSALQARQFAAQNRAAALGCNGSVTWSFNLENAFESTTVSDLPESIDFF